MRMKPVLLVALTALASCSSPEDTARYTLEPPPLTATVPNRIGRVEVRDVQLPDYASGQEIGWQTPDGAVRSNPQNIWAETPQRAVTRTLARQIEAASGATAIAEPWPFAEPPARRLEVRVSRMLAGADGLFHLSGQYFVSPAGFSGSDLQRSFDIAVPLAGEGPAAIAAAQARAIQILATRIAQLS
ncbi:hypothetical protein CN97_04490 [Haematobacter massiliensis]|mgnify:CR=1 FL=1|uniref:ABC-type transport auxiliary lipoprotein component domain-containing protein n=2 Tax=Haematobacter massiliensis TaxID=195105 RepID=A0A086YBP7_9RHOB|nr:PqiC family protein [Haematobacter massiliensis]KFI31697.1 hypothetical protein CN97_04490 [Haematobacter massiliensis]